MESSEFVYPGFTERVLNCSSLCFSTRVATSIRSRPSGRSIDRARPSLKFTVHSVQHWHSTHFGRYNYNTVSTLLSHE